MRFSVALATLAAAAYAAAQSPSNSIVENVLAVPELSTLASLVQQPAYSDILAALQGLTKGTLLAPTNAALDAVIATNPSVETVKTVLQYHVLGETFAAAGIPAFAAVDTILAAPSLGVGKTQKLVATKSDGVVTFRFGLGASNVTRADITSSNGQLHVINQVLFPPKLTSTTAADAKLNELVKAVVAADLVATVDTVLKGITVFAPVDAAFTALGPVTDLKVLGDVLKYHVIPSGQAFSSDLTDGQTITTAQGESVTISITNGAVRVNNANVIAANVLTENGVVHVIDQVILPQSIPARTKSIVQNVIATPELSELLALVTKPEYADILAALSTLTSGTLLAPSNEALREILATNPSVETVKAVLKYHVIPKAFTSGDLLPFNTAATLLEAPGLGVNKTQSIVAVKKDGVVTIRFGLGSANVTRADIASNNGQIHIINKVLLPPKKTSVTATDAKLTSLVNAVVAAGLVSAVDTDLKGITIFAPVDAAFAKVGPVNDTKVLGDILKYHIVPAVAFSGDLREGQEFTTVQGAKIKISLAGGAKVNNANIALTDVLVENGVVHVIDAVLVPAAPSPSPKARSAAASVTFSVPAVALASIAALLLNM